MDSVLYDSVFPQIYNWVIMVEVHSIQFILRYMHVTLLFNFEVNKWNIIQSFSTSTITFWVT